MPYCYYYQATVRKADAWFLVAILRSFEHLAFDRTLEKSSSRFEFFVPHDLDKYFVKLMAYFQKEGIVAQLEKLPNRLEAGDKF